MRIGPDLEAKNRLSHPVPIHQGVNPGLHIRPSGQCPKPCSPQQDPSDHGKTILTAQPTIKGQHFLTTMGSASRLDKVVSKIALSPLEARQSPLHRISVLHRIDLIFQEVLDNLCQF